MGEFSSKKSHGWINETSGDRTLYVTSHNIGIIKGILMRKITKIVGSKVTFLFLENIGALGMITFLNKSPNLP